MYTLFLNAKTVFRKHTLEPFSCSRTTRWYLAKNAGLIAPFLIAAPTEKVLEKRIHSKLARRENGGYIKSGSVSREEAILARIITIDNCTST